MDDIDFADLGPPPCFSKRYRDTSTRRHQKVRHEAPHLQSLSELQLFCRRLAAYFIDMNFIPDFVTFT